MACFAASCGVSRQAVLSNLSIERTSSGELRYLAAGSHVERQVTRMLETPRIRFLVAAVSLCLAQIAFAGEVKVGLQIEVEGEGFFLNPIVTRINVTGVQPESLAAKAGIVKGDEITSIEGQIVKGRRAGDLKAYMQFGAGESRTLSVRHADGGSFEAKLTKPKE